MEPSADSMISRPDWLFNVLRCPHTRETLRPCDSELLGRLRQIASAQGLSDQAGAKIKEPIQSGLVNESQTWFYLDTGDYVSMTRDSAIRIHTDKAA